MTDPLATAPPTDAAPLVTGASGYVGGAARAPAARGGLDGPGADPPPRLDGRPAVGRPRRGGRGRRGLGRRHAPGARGRRRRVVPRALDGRPARLRGARPRGGDAPSPRRPTEAGVSRIVYLGGLHPDDEVLSPHLASRVEVGRILLDSGRADRGAPGRRRARRRVGVVRHAALPHDPPAGDGRAEVARQQDPADRHRRRRDATSSAPAACRPRSTAPSTSAAPRC